MIRLARLVVVLNLCAAGLGARVASAQSAGEPTVQVQVDLHLPVPVIPVPVPAGPRRHQRPPRYQEAPMPAQADWSEPDAPPTRGAQAFSVPPDRVPGRGLCRIWYDDLPPDRQPPPMSCGRAHHVAQSHGGRVIWAESGRAHEDGRVASASYGFVDFRGVPPDRLPPPGSCRVWFEGVPPDRQPPPGPCEHMEREARRTGGRLLYMPGP